MPSLPVAGVSDAVLIEGDPSRRHSFWTHGATTCLKLHREQGLKDACVACLEVPGDLKPNCKMLQAVAILLKRKGEPEIEGKTAAVHLRSKLRSPLQLRIMALLKDLGLSDSGQEFTISALKPYLTDVPVATAQASLLRLTKLGILSCEVRLVREGRLRVFKVLEAQEEAQ